jgi:hypothetical protein
MDYNINSLLNILNDIGIFPVFGIAFLIGTYIFWRESRIEEKDNNSIFDQWFITSIIVAVVGRVAYIIAFPDVFKNVEWFYLPYERFNNVVYLFRTLPWKYLAIWDGGFLFTAIAFAFLYFNFAYSTYIKKWAWKTMLNPVVLSSQFMLGVALADFAYLAKQQEVLLYSFIFLFIWLIYYLYVQITRKYKLKTMIVPVIYTLLSYILIIVIFLSQSITLVDRINTVILGIIVFTIVYKFIQSYTKPNLVVIESVSAVRQITITPNKAIKLGSLRK